ncbi:hypothetical protein DICPUDRAFT_96157 [Dictyostelium purpureum]|uniref:Transmembrane protein n=1 Tax=Dictyostelium purpureum TaxID=5786 RepID=F1A5L7_DICPU|nr:uncharacterized protein DICPUDRAFT_96157 [Dictyostelium purpureum]EGC28517.1 hypothetical protein DICPUDRAFT_96157 [Dictyostelium purpureum]|eukprot:XP_003294961.1 hypothetical protein DICPUDRAFT_96157 [Dictyostelium purpureum]
MKRGVAFLALFFSLIVLGCCVVSIAMPWYRVKETSKLDSDKYQTTLYYWDEFRVTDEELNSTNIIYKDGDKYDDKGFDTVKKVFIVSLAFTCLATLLTAIAIILVFIAFVSKSRIFGIIAGIFMFLTFALLLVSFFQFMRINGALNDDDDFCGTKGKIEGYDIDETYCHKFLSSAEGTLTKLNYGPYVGWWITLGGIFFSMFAFGPLFSASRK